jgi:hypothetical protein
MQVFFGARSFWGEGRESGVERERWWETEDKTNVWQGLKR